MRSTQLLTHLALWTSTAHAFYPYTPEWLEELQKKRSLETRENGITLGLKQRGSQSSAPASERAAREAARLFRKYDRRRPSNKARGDSIARRENNYNILEAEDSGDHLTAGIDQDGTDYSYFVNAKFGSKGKELLLLLDTGAGSSWVMGSDCSSEACSLHDSFGSDDSDTFESSDDDFSISYGSGTVKGTLAKDTISVAGMSFSYQFGVASETSDDFLHFAFDGILGLSMNDAANENFLEVMDEADELEANVFGVSLHRAVDGTNDGEIRFGSADTDRYTGDITYTSLSEDHDDWAVELEDASYDGQSAGVGGVRAFIDTGTTFIFGPEDKVKALHDLIPGAESSDGMVYSVPCDSSASLEFTFSGTGFEVSSKDWISPQNSQGKCTSNIYGQEVVEGAWLLGDTFLKNVYSVFDKDERRIGFATPSDQTSSNSTMSASSTTSASASTSTNSGLPSLGLGGQESEPTSTADADSSDGDDENISSTISGNSKLAFAACIATVFALLA